MYFLLLFLVDMLTVVFSYLFTCWLIGAKISIPSLWKPTKKFDERKEHQVSTPKRHLNEWKRSMGEVLAGSLSILLSLYIWIILPPVFKFAVMLLIALSLGLFARRSMLGKLGLVLATVGPESQSSTIRTGIFGRYDFFSSDFNLRIEARVGRVDQHLGRFLVLLLARPLLRVWGFSSIFSE